ncbi:MAG: 4Fe-4S binding protein [Peptococcaceae bacterium]|nr:4Fe-4S binding protein [Peptococcaceae bacterium]
MASFYIKTNRIFTPVRKYAWIFVPFVALGGLWFPKLGLLMIPVMTALAIIGFFKGKFWCGNLCPHGSLFDRLVMPFSANKKIPAFLKSKAAMAVMFAWFMYIMVSRLMKVFAVWGSTAFIDKLGYVFVMNYLMVTVIGTTLAFLISPRAWCNFCPMGTLEILAYKLGKLLKINKRTDKKVTVASKSMCHTCGKCSRVCPMQLTPYLEFSEKNQFNSEACIRCSTCVKNCPAGILSLSNEKEAARICEETDTDGYRKRRKIAAVIRKVRKLGEDVNEYTFRLIQPERVEFEPGQFILVKIQESPVMYRAYSISSYSGDGAELSITVKRMPGGYGTGIVFDTFKEGGLVELDGPMGRELVPGRESNKVLFVAGGIGITPFVSMTSEMVEKTGCSKEVKLIYGVNRPEEFIYDDHFEKLKSQCKKFEYIKVVASGDNWQGRKGFVTDAMKDMDLKGYKIYMCGPRPMVNASLKVLKDAGVDEEDIFYESA